MSLFLDLARQKFLRLSEQGAPQKEMVAATFDVFQEMSNYVGARRKGLPVQFVRGLQFSTAETSNRRGRYSLITRHILDMEKGEEMGKNYKKLKFDTQRAQIDYVRLAHLPIAAPRRVEESQRLLQLAGQLFREHKYVLPPDFVYSLPGRLTNRNWRDYGPEYHKNENGQWTKENRMAAYMRQLYKNANAYWNLQNAKRMKAERVAALRNALKKNARLGLSSLKSKPRSPAPSIASPPRGSSSRSSPSTVYSNASSRRNSVNSARSSPSTVYSNASSRRNSINSARSSPSLASTRSSPAAPPPAHPAKSKSASPKKPAATSPQKTRLQKLLSRGKRWFGKTLSTT